MNYSTSVAEACERADAVMVLTEWPEFVGLDPGELAAMVRSRVVIDGRNCLDAQRWSAAGWTVYALGRRSPCRADGKSTPGVSREATSASPADERLAVCE